MIWRRRRRREYVHEYHYHYTGESAAHQAIESLLSAFHKFYDVLMGYQAVASHAACLDHLTQATAWLATVKIADLDLISRWTVAVRLAVYRSLFDNWLVTHADHPIAADVEGVYSVLCEMENQLIPATRSLAATLCAGASLGGGLPAP